MWGLNNFHSTSLNWLESSVMYMLPAMCEIPALYKMTRKCIEYLMRGFWKVLQKEFGYFSKAFYACPRNYIALRISEYRQSIRRAQQNLEISHMIFLLEQQGQ